MASVLELPKRTSKTWTYDDYCRMDDDVRYEVFDGELIPMQPPSPSFNHQFSSGNLYDCLRSFVVSRRLGVVVYAPLDVVLDAHNVLQPDLLFISTERQSIIQQRGVFGAPDLVVEIASPGTERRDQEQKKELYARFGVREYWLVDQAKRSLCVLALEGKSYVEHSVATGDGLVTSRVLKGLKVKLSEVFGN